MKNVKNLEDFKIICNNSTPLHINLVEREISGGSLSIERINTIDEFEDAESIQLSGLDQKSFEYFISNYGNRFKGIAFWKCPRISDLSPLASLTNIEFLTYFWNQRATSLWNMKRNINLRGISIYDFSRLHTLEELPTAAALEELQFGDAVWDGLVLESLSPLAKCKKLKKLTFSAKKLLDGKIEPLGAISNIREIDFPMNFFNTEQVAWLKAHLPEDVESSVLIPYNRIEEPFEIDGKKRDTFIIGKRKPFLSWEEDRKRIDGYINKFNKLVEQYRSCKDLNPPPIKYAVRKKKSDKPTTPPPR